MTNSNTSVTLLIRRYALLKILLFFVSVIWALPSLAQSSNAVIKPGDNLVVEGIPPVPLAIAEQANRYTEVREAGFFDWHPTQREMLIGTRFGDTQQVHELKMPGGARAQLTFFPDRVTAALFEPVFGKYFVFSKDLGGGGGFNITATTSQPETSRCSPMASRAISARSWPTQATAWFIPLPGAPARTLMCGS